MIFIISAFLFLIIGSSDFVAEAQTVTFEVSDSSNRRCVEIAINDDVIVEGDEQFLVKFGDISNDLVTIGEVSQSCVTIIDDDGWCCMCEMSS